jgi:hypothetical protein
MVVEADSKELVLVSDSVERLFLGYADNAKPNSDDWRLAIKSERASFARMMKG